MSVGDIELEPVDIRRISVVAPAAFADDALPVAAHVIGADVGAGSVHIVAVGVAGKEVVQIGTSAADGILAGVDEEAGCGGAKEHVETSEGCDVGELHFR